MNKTNDESTSSVPQKCEDAQRLFDRLNKEGHRNVDPCFMTGKGCVYTDAIEGLRKERHDQGKFAGFMVMPFRKNLGVFFDNCLRPFFRDHYGDDGKFRIEHGAEVRRPGIIICEGICKRIQESNFIVADLSLPNPNVFYELGLAYGIGQKIVVIHHDRSPFGTHQCNYFKEAGCKAYAYRDLDTILEKDFVVSNHIWKNPRLDEREEASLGNIILVEQLWEPAKVGGENRAGELQKLRQLVRDLLEAETDEGGKAFDSSSTDDNSLDFRTHVLSAVNLSIQQIVKNLEEVPVVQSYLEYIKKFKDAQPCRGDWPRPSRPDQEQLCDHRAKSAPTLPRPFKDLQRSVDQAYCVIVLTGGADCHPMAYFWLGYSHARGKNVIPITVIEKEDMDIKDLAFDIRAQRHMTFVRQAPARLAPEMKQTLEQMIRSDFSEYSRKRFWDKMLGRRGDVSIFTGTIRNTEVAREMIGDWDLRTASELTAYFGRHQYRAKIETPVYAPENVPELTPKAYIDGLSKMISDKNCILIASPDVNPLTEIVLGNIYSVPETALFGRPLDTSSYPGAIIAVKEKVVHEGDKFTPANRAFYREEKSAQNRRGFASSRIRQGRVMEDFVSQVDAHDKQIGSSIVYAHVAIIRHRPEKGQDRHLIVLNGVGGPATFAMTHVLTGGVNKEFVSYQDSFDPAAESEKILKSVLEEIDRREEMDHRRGYTAVEFIVRVEIGPSRDQNRAPVGDLFDWRRIRGFTLCDNVFGENQPFK